MNLTGCMGHKCNQVPQYDSVMYNHRDRICSPEDCQRHMENHHQACNGPYAGIDPSRCFTPDSMSTDADGRDCSQTTWPSATDNDSVSNCSYVSSCGADADSFMANSDFASAVTKAATMSGLSVVGSTVSPMVPDTRKVHKTNRPRRRANRPESPYSTDSNNYSAIVPPVHKSCPKSDRLRQTGEQLDASQASALQSNCRTANQADDIPLKKPAVPYSAASASRGKPQTNTNSHAFTCNPPAGNYHFPTLANASNAFDTQTNVV